MGCGSSKGDVAPAPVDPTAEETKGGSGESDTNSEGNDHTGRRMTRSASEQENESGRTGAPGGRKVELRDRGLSKCLCVWAWCPV